MFLYIDYPSWITPEIIPGFFVRWYSMMYVVAFALTYYLFKIQVKERGLGYTEEHISGFFTWTIVATLLGGRILSTLVYHPDDTYWRAPWLIFWPFDSQMNFTGLAGLSYHGGLLGAVVGAFLYTWRKKLDTLEWMDMTAMAAPLGYTFGRLGNFINRELFGRATSSPWGVLFPEAPQFSVEKPWVSELADELSLPVINGQVNLPRHPSQLYEAFSEGLLLWLIFWFIFRKNKPYQGFIVSLYLIGYGLARFIVEYYREPDPQLGFMIAGDPSLLPGQNTISFLNISMGQLLSTPMILGGIALLIFFYFKDKNKKNPLEEAQKPKAKKKRKKLY